MKVKKEALLSLHYLPNIQYFSKFLLHDKVWIEQQEHYQKGSYRNRLQIAAANGPLRLSIPLVKGKHRQQNIREVRIAHHELWPQQHWQSIQSAYGNAPFFEHYSDILQPFFSKKYTFLFDFNLELLQSLLSLIGLPTPFKLTSEYLPEVPSTTTDYRSLISPKKDPIQTDPTFKNVKYVQVFEEKHGFLPNLSILDVLFCKGPETIILLEQSIIRN
jgi:hypothetical protein